MDSDPRAVDWFFVNFSAFYGGLCDLEFLLAIAFRLGRGIWFLQL